MKHRFSRKTGILVCLSLPLKRPARGKSSWRKDSCKPLRLTRALKQPYQKSRMAQVKPAHQLCSYLQDEDKMDHDEKKRFSGTRVQILNESVGLSMDLDMDLQYSTCQVRKAFTIWSWSSGGGACLYESWQTLGMVMIISRYRSSNPTHRLSCQPIIDPLILDALG